MKKKSKKSKYNKKIVVKLLADTPDPDLGSPVLTARKILTLRIPDITEKEKEEHRRNFEWIKKHDPLFK